jgi:hypothetical protein
MTTAGTLDGTFNNPGGRLTIGFGGGTEDEGLGLAMQADGSIIICAFWNANATCDEDGYRSRGDNNHGRNNDVAVDFEVRLPRGVNVGVWSVNGEVSVEGATAEVVAIVSAKSEIPELSRVEVADIFLGRMGRLPKGKRAIPIDLPEGSPARDEFYQRFAGKSGAQVKAHWSKIIFTGRGKPPEVVADEQAAKQRVAGDANAIAYIERELVDSSVRILTP